MRLPILLTMALAVILSACQSTSQELTEQQKANLAAEVDAVASSWWAAWAAVDLETGMSFVSHAPEASFTNNEITLYGVDAIRADWTNWESGLREQDIDFTDSYTIVLSPNIAYTIRKYAVVATRADGSITPELTGVETLVWVKENGDWKMRHGHEASLRDSWQTRLDLEADP